MKRRRRMPRTLGQAPLQPQQPSTSRAATGALLTPKELAARLKVSAVTVRRMLKAQKLPYIQVGSRVRFNLSDVLQTLPKFKPTDD
jgi:excisionase family DNA binding protein